MRYTTPNCLLPQAVSRAVPRRSHGFAWSRPPRDPVIRWLLDNARFARRFGLATQRRDYVETAELIRAGCTITRATAAARMAEATRKPTEDQIEKWRMDE